MTSLSETFSHGATECMEVGAKHINSDGFKKAPLPLRQRGFAQSASELSCVPLKRRNGNGAILKASEFDCAEGGAA